MTRDDTQSVDPSLTLSELFRPPEGLASVEWRNEIFERLRWERPGASLVLDRFPDGGGAACSFVRIEPRARRLSVTIEGRYGIGACAAGGWLAQPLDGARASYWIPRPPVHRRYDSQRRILAERGAAFASFRPADGSTTIEFDIGDDAPLECAVWMLPSEAVDLVAALEAPLTLVRQPQFMLASHTSLCGPADVYVYLIHGHVYEDRFDWQRKRKICSELEAYAIYVALCGLETATGDNLYRLLKRQIAFSVISRQDADGGWRHGEWTDFMESHFRFHNAAILLLAAALEEAPNDDLRRALDKAAAYIATKTDRTDIGLWFFHDSLEASPELMDKSGATWIASRELGKSPATKMILNSHLDAIVVLDRYRQVTGNGGYVEHVQSALAAARTLLAMRPADWLYSPLYRAVRLTLLPVREAEQLPLPLRALKRLTGMVVIPNLYRVKRRFPRMVMPGGLIERHLSRLHFGVNYHSVNVADLTRVWRRFTNEDFKGILDRAVRAVTGTSLLRYWIERKQRQALGYWVEALYHLCTLDRDAALRRHLAEAILAALEAGMGLPPSLLGCHPEAVGPALRVRCPSPADPRLRVANLSRGLLFEVVVVNPTSEPVDLSWERCELGVLRWTAADGAAIAEHSPLSIPARGWIHGRSG